ncbi:hypothetical protein BBAD15_g6914 [Beauveria bassiana D1-5]|uniref:Uncharacterized protein n=1 Tax=Beauveria bassiana D1-5 TaxID=1245745 RepID=A0A0A2VJJ1_BEABA|nr:hypothetical protein BBAD15_g6914 [Beauveria bassiana D1-5]
MAETMTECAVCMMHFESHDELRKHSFLFQSEIAILLSKLQSLIAHQWPAQNRNQEIYQTGDSDHREETPGSSDVTNRCPHDDCANKTATFDREQELIRHYGIHYICNEYCLSCGIVYTRANKFWQHKCATKNPTDHVKRRKRALRDMVKEQLEEQLARTSQRKKRARATPNTNRAKRLKISDDSDASDSTGSGSLDVQLIHRAGQEEDGCTNTAPETTKAQNVYVSANSVPPAGTSLVQAPLWPNGYCDPNFHVQRNPVFTPLWPEGMPTNNSMDLLESIHSNTSSTLYGVTSQLTEMFSQPQEEFPIHKCL